MRPFFIISWDIDNHRGGARNCYQTPPCKQRGGGGKAGTGVVKYNNQDVEASGTKRVTFASYVHNQPISFGSISIPEFASRRRILIYN